MKFYNAARLTLKQRKGIKLISCLANGEILFLKKSRNLDILTTIKFNTFSRSLEILIKDLDYLVNRRDFM